MNVDRDKIVGATLWKIVINMNFNICKKMVLKDNCNREDRKIVKNYGTFN